MSSMHYNRTYVFFLIASFVATAAVFVAGRLLSWSFVLFIVVNTGNAHYIVAYLGSYTAWRKLPSRVMVKRLLIWLGFGAAYVMLFYVFGLPFAYAIFSILLITTYHFARDYTFFHGQIKTSYKVATRPIPTTIFLGTAYLVVLFAILFYYPDKIRILFLSPVFGRELFGALAVFGLFVLVVSAIVLFRTLELRRMAAAFIIFPSVSAGLLGFAGSVDPRAYVYIVVLWHFMLWWFFSFMKIASSTEAKHTRRSIDMAFRGNMIERSVAFLMHSTRTFVFTVLFVQIVVILAAFLYVFFRPDVSFNAFAHNNFLWGLYGYPLWSFLHIVFTAFPRYQKA